MLIPDVMPVGNIHVYSYIYSRNK